MSAGKVTRRGFVWGTAVVCTGWALGNAPRQGKKALHLSCNSYPWQTFFAREGRKFEESLDAGLAEVAKSGMDGFEPGINAPEDIEKYAPLLKKHGLQMRSLYVNSSLHAAEEAKTSMARIVAIAENARKALGTRIIVTNPSPIRWGGPEGKTDAQLGIQAEALGKTGAKLRSMGMVLAYHNHDIELRNAAREFHHMMLGTDPKDVTLCLDCHWIYRGSGNSTVALMDVLKLYGARVSELHLRQSVGNIWSETLGEGDIDYPSVAGHLRSIGVKPLLVLEQAPEQGTPKTMDTVESHRKSRAYVDRVFAALG